MVASPRRIWQGLNEAVARHHESGDAAALGAADWLYLAAAPTFAIMALLTAVLGGRPPDMLYSAVQDALPLSGMPAMYVLMSAHTAPWLKLIAKPCPTVLIRYYSGPNNNFPVRRDR